MNQMPNSRQRRRVTNALILNSSMNTTLRHTDIGLPSVTQVLSPKVLSPKQQADQMYMTMRGRALSFNNHFEKKKKITNIILTLKEIDELHDNAKRFYLSNQRKKQLQLTQKFGHFPFFEQATQDMRKEDQLLRDETPKKFLLNNKYFYYLYGEMNFRKKRVLKAPSRGLIR